MDTTRLKETYGEDITFWGGGVDSQHVLPFGTPEEVRDLVRGCIATGGPGGGYMISSSNSIPSYANPENVQAMVNANREYGAYPLRV